MQFYRKLKRRNPCGNLNPNESSLTKIPKTTSRPEELPITHSFQTKRETGLAIGPLMYPPTRVYQNKRNHLDPLISIEAQLFPRARVLSMIQSDSDVTLRLPA